MLTREVFVAKCTQLIQEAKAEITAINQISGYIKYHKEIKAHGFFTTFRDLLSITQKTHGYDLSHRYAYINNSKIGGCQEFAEYLAYKLIKFLQENNNNAFIEIVASNLIDHVYLNVFIKLENEQVSRWEIDAWDPRIIDISIREDGSIKNQEVLCYGKNPRMKHTFEVNTFQDNSNTTDLFLLGKPEEGQNPDMTPQRNMLKKHKNLFSDCSLRHRYERRWLNENGSIGHFQKQSSWQLTDVSQNRNKEAIQSESSPIKKARVI